MPPPPLKYLGGDPAIDLVNTVDWTSAGPRAERLPTYDRLAEWAVGAGIITPAQGARLVRAARERPRVAADALASAHETRAVLRRLLADRAAGHRSGGPHLARFNARLADALARLELAQDRQGTAALEWRGLGEELASPLWPVLWSAARLLASGEADRIRVCD